MNEPTVCAIMLTADRPALARRAVECFRAQTYESKRLLIWDSGDDEDWFEDVEDEDVVHVKQGLYENIPSTVGALRNCANAFWTEYPILIHWDDDDWSHPNRIAEQVALLQSSGADCVGYNEMLFWRSFETSSAIPPYGEAWLYSNPSELLGTSLCYWRKTWERKPFAATSQGEDRIFRTGLKCASVSACGQDAPPRMVARIHGSNTSGAYAPSKLEAESRRRNPTWRRVPEWEDFCRSVME